MESANRRLECRGPAPVRELNEEITACLRQGHAHELRTRNLPEATEFDLGSVQQLYTDSMIGKVRAERLNTMLHAFGRGWEVGPDVRGRRDRDDSLLGGVRRQLTCLLKRANPVVESGKNVRMQVDHGHR
jgi:hypothetical protein